MAGRKRKAESDYKIMIHKIRKYRYASTQPWYEDPETGRMKRRYIYWGDVTEDLKFIPNRRYWEASEETRARFIFPKDWDISEINRNRNPESYDPHAVRRFDNVLPDAPLSEQKNSRLYGGPWFLWKIAEKIQLTNDLEQIYEGDRESISDFMSMVMFLLLCKADISYLPGWQKFVKIPSIETVTESSLYELLQNTDSGKVHDFYNRRIKEHNGTDTAILQVSASLVMPGSVYADPYHTRSCLAAVLCDSFVPLCCMQPGWSEPLSESIRKLRESITGLNEKAGTAFYVQNEEYPMVSHLPLENAEFLTDVKMTPEMTDVLSRNDMEILDTLIQNSLTPKNHTVLIEKMSVESARCCFNDMTDKDISEYSFFFLLDPSIREIEIQNLQERLMLEEKNMAAFTATGIYRSAELKEKYLSDKTKFSGAQDTETGTQEGMKELFDQMMTAGVFILISNKAGDNRELYRRVYEVRRKALSDYRNLYRRSYTLLDHETADGFGLLLLCTGILASCIESTRRTKLSDKYASTDDILSEMMPIRCTSRRCPPDSVTKFTRAQKEICTAFELEIPTRINTDNKEKHKGRPKGTLKKTNDNFE